MNNCKINFLIITYNQNHLIGRAIESLLIQKDYGINEIVICDDCSTDNNWEVIKKYVVKYPNLIRAYRNEKNLGIIANCEKVISLRGNADLFSLLSGDDAICDGFIKEVQLIVNKYNIEIHNHAVTLYFDWKNVLPNGKEFIMRNNLISRGYNALSLKIRGLIYNRSILANEKVINQFKPVPIDKGISLAEEYFDSQWQLYSEKNFYHSYTGSIYYSGLGVSTTLNSEQFKKETIYKWRTLLRFYNLDYKDKMYCKFKIQQYKFYLNPSLKLLVKTINYYVKSIEPKYGIKFRSHIIRLLNLKIH